VLYDAIEQVYSIVNANFAADFAALLTQKGLGGLGLVTSADIVKRQTAEVFVAKRKTLPSIGIYGVRAVTRAKDQGKRDSRNTIAMDYFASGPESDGAKLQKQVELAAETLLKSVDRIVGGVGGGVFGAAVQDEDITVDLQDAYVEGETPTYLGVATVTFSVDDRDDQV
jgi:hypothetical protein